jgi:DNA-directed RNA polymerase specialized sigma24 family protein
VTPDQKKTARAGVRKAQTDFERAHARVQRERAEAREARRSRFAQAQAEGLTVREIAEAAGLDYSNVAAIIRGK